MLFKAAPKSPPTFVADYEGASWDTTTSPKTTGTFDGALGDVLVSLLANSNDHGDENYTWTSSPSETWTENAETTGTIENDVFLQTATAVLSAARTGMTVTATRTAGSTFSRYNHVVAHFTGSDGVGNTARLTGNGVAAPSFAFTTNFDNSAIVYLIADWNATDGTTRTHRTVNGFTPTAGNGQELVYFRNAVEYTVYGAYIVDAGAAGSKTIGISAPAGGDCLIIAVEIRGQAAVGGGSLTADADLAITATPTATATRNTTAAADLAATTALTAAATKGLTAAADLAVTAVLTATADAELPPPPPPDLIFLQPIQANQQLAYL